MGLYSLATVSINTINKLVVEVCLACGDNKPGTHLRGLTTQRTGRDRKTASGDVNLACEVRHSAMISYRDQIIIGFVRILLKYVVNPV